MAVGRGMTDQRAGELVRQESGRHAYPKTPRGRRRNWDDGTTVADWIELFAEPIYETRRAKRWPRVVALDGLPFKMAEIGEWGEPVSGGRSAFHVFGSYGWDTLHEKGKVIALRSAPRFSFNQGYEYWVEYLRTLDSQLEGRPWQIVIDNDRELIRAINLLWPRGREDSPVVIICHWHLRNPPEHPTEPGSRLLA
jgi:hypothetical protein